MRKAESRGLVHSSHRRDYSLPFAGIFENLGVIDLPFNLDIAKKSLVSTMSTLYATMWEYQRHEIMSSCRLIVTCLVFVSTEVITFNVPVDYFESKGFYTFLYRWNMKHQIAIKTEICFWKYFIFSGSILFMCYIFFYVLRVKVELWDLGSNESESWTVVGILSWVTWRCTGCW